MVDLIKDLWGYLKARKKYWLAPIVLMLVFCGLILIFGSSTGLAPFILFSVLTMNETRAIYRDVAISGIAFLLWYDVMRANWILLAGSVYLLLCLLAAPLRRWNDAFWTAVTKWLNTVSSPVLFGAIFFLVLLPIALLFRLFRKKKPDTTSTFVPVKDKIDAAFFEVPW